VSIVRLLFSAALLVLACSGAGAQGEPDHPSEKSGGILALLPAPATTEHTITIAGRTLSYEAEAGTLPLIDAGGKVTAKMFYVAYDAKPAAPDITSQSRPITFVFNGGPGAASAYLQLGGLGPRILATGRDGAFLDPPQELEDNPDTWLPMTDLVFVDPVGTGYSRAAAGEKDSDFWSVDADASAMGAFIRLYLQKKGRSGSPLYLVGESYGGFRAALLARTLQADVGLSPSGVVLISPALEFTFLDPDEFQPLHWALTLPSMAAVHLLRSGAGGTDFRNSLTLAEHYALTDYLPALAGGLEQGGAAASASVSRLTGLPLALVQRRFARVPVELFAKESDHAEGRVLSLYDGLIDTADIAPETTRDATPDPVLDRSVPVLTSAFTRFVHDALKYDTVVSYRLLNRETSRNWKYGTGSRQGYAGVMDDLQKARALNPALGVLIVNGYTDLVTPYMVSRYLVGQLPTLPCTRPIETRVYQGGHMMYLRPDSRHALKRDAAALYGDAEPGADQPWQAACPR
jgi:carboxypeptidase C (cathepsin A)